MRYTSAVVLSTLAVGQSVAAGIHNRHASFHERRNVEAKRDLKDVDWSKVAYDLKDVDWNKVDYGSGSKPTGAAQSAAPQATQPSYNAPVKTVPASVPSVTAQPYSPQPSSGSSSGSSSGDIGHDIWQGVHDFAKAIGSEVGLNSNSSGNGIYLGNDGPYKANFVNGASKEIYLYCWRKGGGYTAQSVNVNAPDILAYMPAGSKLDVVFPANTPGACAPAYPDTKLALFGGVDQTWFEFNLGGTYGTFDISKNINMKGNSIHAKGNKCTADMTTCAFQCLSGDSCMTGYELLNCEASNGGGSGKDPTTGDPSGGCTSGSDSDTIVVTFS